MVHFRHTVADPAAVWRSLCAGVREEISSFAARTLRGGQERKALS